MEAGKLGCLEGRGSPQESVMQRVSVRRDRGTILAVRGLEGCLEAQPGRDFPARPPACLPTHILDSQSWKFSHGMGMPASRQMLARGWRDRKPSNVRWARGARAGALTVPS